MDSDNMSMKRLVLVWFLVCAGHAMFGQAPLDQLVSLRLEQQSLEEALYLLLEQEEVRLSFRNDQLPATTVSINVRRQPVHLVLDQLLQNTSLTYRALGEQILIIRKPERILTSNYTISGFVQDRATGERLIGATIYDELSDKGAVSNEYGFFSLTLPAGLVYLRGSYLGYQIWENPLDLQANETIIVDLSGVITLTEVVVYAHNDSITNPIGGVIAGDAIGLRETMLLPSLGGEPDILRTAHLLPGVHTGTDGVEGLQVRGGDAGQNLVLMDGVPVYNVGHAIGLFSIFNSSSIRSAQLLKGGFPARYSGRLSSVLDVRTKEGNLQRMTGSAEVGLLTSRASLEGPIQKEKSSFFVAGRWSFIHWLLRDRSSVLKARRGESGFTDYRFYDINAKVNHAFSNRDRIYLSLYRGDDAYSDRTDRVSFLSVPRTNGGQFDYVVNQNYREGISWGNSVGALRWNHIFTDKLFSNFSLTYSELAVTADYSQRDSLTELTTGQIQGYFNEGLFTSGISDAGIRVDLHYLPLPRREWRFGFGGNRRIFEPGALEIDENDEGEGFVNDPISTTEVYTYLEGQGEWGEQLRWNAGAHAVWWRVRNENYLSLQPRLSLRYAVHRDLSLRLSASRMVQYLHLLSNSSIGLPTDLWVPSTDDVRPAEMWLATIGGVQQFAPGWQTSVELYYKKMDHLLAFQEGIGDLRDWEAKVTPGEGEAYGAEIMISKTEGRLTGWLSYTLAWSNRSFAEINFGETFPFKYDRRHDLKIAAVYQINPHWFFSANWVYSTGFAFSIPLVKYRVGFPGIVLSEDIDVEILDPGAKNQYRMPAYHRLDINMHLEWGEESNVRHALNLGVYNVYDRKNPLYYDIRRFYENRDGQLSSVRQFVEVWLAPMLPIVSYRLSF